MTEVMPTARQPVLSSTAAQLFVADIDASCDSSHASSAFRSTLSMAIRHSTVRSGATMRNWV